MALDLGHTVMDERLDLLTALEHREEHLMPGAREALRRLELPVAIWANTRIASEAHVRQWLARAGLSEHVRWVITSVDAGARKPSAAFFEFALARMDVGPADVLFVGNQLNTDIAGGGASGIPTAYLSDAVYRSLDDRPTNVRATYTIRLLHELPSLVASLMREPRPVERV